MNRNLKRILSAIFIISLAVFLSGVAMAESEVSIKGTINEDGQLVDDDANVYEITENDEGEMLMDKIGEKVIVKGTVMEAEGKNTITVIEFNLDKE